MKLNAAVTFQFFSRVLETKNELKTTEGTERIKKIKKNSFCSIWPLFIMFRSKFVDISHMCIRFSWFSCHTGNRAMIFLPCWDTGITLPGTVMNGQNDKCGVWSGQTKNLGNARIQVKHQHTYANRNPSWNAASELKLKEVIETQSELS